MKRKPITASQRVAELVAEHGSLRKAGAAVGIDHAFLWKISNGQKLAKGDTLARLGLRETVTITYERIEKC